MRAERARWEAEVEELKRESAKKQPSAKVTAQQQINFNEAMRKTSEAKDRKIDELQKEIEALRKVVYTKDSRIYNKGLPIVHQSRYHGGPWDWVLCGYRERHSSRASPAGFPEFWLCYSASTTT